MTEFNPLPPLERLNELLEIVEIPPDKFGVWSGLVWKVKRRGTKGIGSVAGTPVPNPNNPDRVDWRVKVDDVNYYASRIIYYMTCGEDPRNIQVDHKDRNWLNNNMWNLRLDINGSIQKKNRSILKNNTSGVTGVSLHTKTNKWRTAVWVNNKNKPLGEFACKIEAAHAVNEKWRELGWLELGRKLNDLNAIQCDCDKCKSQVDEIAE